MQVNYFAQEETKCAPTILGDLSTCFSSYNIATSLIYSSDGTSATLFLEGSANQGNVTACLSQYNNARMSCPDAPVIVQDTHAGYRAIKRA
jgi:hypothetical protein